MSPPAKKKSSRGIKGKKKTVAKVKSRKKSTHKESSKLVLTPGGWRPSNKVHILEVGHHISGKGGQLRIVETATGKLVKALGPISKKNRFTGGIKARVSGKIPSLPDNGWIAYSDWTNPGPTSIVYFSSKWIVPPPPQSNDQQSIFLFNGLQQTSNGPYILQPVLQWGTSALGGGTYWSIANWYVNGPGGHAIISPAGLVTVKSGDVLQGIMTMVGQSGTEYDYTSSFVGYPNSTIDTKEIDQLAYACETLEAYGSDPSQPVAQCSDYPNTPFTAFTDIQIKVGDNLAAGVDAVFQWNRNLEFGSCGQDCKIVSSNSPGGEVDIYY